MAASYDRKFDDVRIHSGGRSVIVPLKSLMKGINAILVIGDLHTMPPIDAPLAKPESISVAQCMKLIDRSRSTVERLCDGHPFRSWHDGRSVRINKSDVLRYLAERIS